MIACLRRPWLWLTTRIAVEVTRWRTRGYEGHHTEAALDDKWADDIAEPGLAPLPVQERWYTPSPVHQWAAEAWRAIGAVPEDPWQPQDTAVDVSLLAAIREHVDGEYTGQIVDRMFSQVNVARIFDDACGPLLRRLAVTA